MMYLLITLLEEKENIRNKGSVTVNLPEPIFYWAYNVSGNATIAFAMSGSELKKSAKTVY